MNFIFSVLGFNALNKFFSGREPKFQVLILLPEFILFQGPPPVQNTFTDHSIPNRSLFS